MNFLSLLRSEPEREGREEREGERAGERGREGGGERWGERQRARERAREEVEKETREEEKNKRSKIKLSAPFFSSCLCGAGPRFSHTKKHLLSVGAMSELTTADPSRSSQLRRSRRRRRTAAAAAAALVATVAVVAVAIASATRSHVAASSSSSGASSSTSLSIQDSVSACFLYYNAARFAGRSAQEAAFESSTCFSLSLPSAMLKPFFLFFLLTQFLPRS